MADLAPRTTGAEALGRAFCFTVLAVGQEALALDA